jgi:hypothetical protein
MPVSNLPSGALRPRLARAAAAFVAAGALGVSAALGLAACGEDREGGSVEEIGPGTTGTGTGGTVPVVPTTGETTGATTTGEATGTTTTGETTTGGSTDTDEE